MSAYFRFLGAGDFRKRTPSPPPFGSMNSTPARSRADRNFSPVSLRPPSGPACASSRFIVGIEMPAALASCSCDHPKSARAAFICLIDTFGIDPRAILCNTFGIDSDFRGGLHHEPTRPFPRRLPDDSRADHSPRGGHRRGDPGRYSRGGVGYPRSAGGDRPVRPFR